MNDLSTIDARGVLTEPATVRIQRLLPGPVDRIWSYVTESGLRRRWLAAGEMTLQVGAPFELVWRNEELNDPPSRRPDGFDEEQRLQCRIAELDPPRRIAFSWGDQGGSVSIDLAPQADQVLLTLIHRRLPEGPMRVGICAGWHVHLDILAARLRGVEPVAFWTEWLRLREEYVRTMPD